MAEKKGRSTVYNHITSMDKLAKVNPENLILEEDFVEYLKSTDKARGTIKQYRANLRVFWCWNLEFNDNIFFVELKKRQLTKFQNHAINEWGWSPRRVRTVKATLSSLSNFIVRILDDEYPNYKSIINMVESPVDRPVRDKSIFDEVMDMQPLLDYLVKNHEYAQACAVSLAMNSGRRKSELLRFKVGWFTPEHTICGGALYKTPEMVQTKGRGEDGKPLYLYTIASSFDPYLKLWMDERKRLKIRSQWLFPRRRGERWIDEPMLLSSMDYWAKSFSEFLGKPFYWHSLRHFFTTKLRNYGIPSNVIQDLMGWDSADMVNRYDDTEKDSVFEKYFGSSGIKKVKEGSLEDL